MAKLIIIRGLPGSGKSTLAVKFASMGYDHFEADQFFIGEDEEYKFNASLLDAAHSWCYGNVVRSLKDGRNVVVSNTFCALWEIEKYLNIAAYMEIELKVYQMFTQYGSIHGIPNDALDRMKSRWWDMSSMEGVEVINIYGGNT